MRMVPCRLPRRPERGIGLSGTTLAVPCCFGFGGAASPVCRCFGSGGFNATGGPVGAGVASCPATCWLPTGGASCPPWHGGGVHARAARMYTYSNTVTYVHNYIYIRIRRYIYIHVHMYIYIYIDMCIDIYINFY